MSAATADKVVRQIEFYFSDSNLPRDRFMLERVHESPEGYVDIGLIATFARMRDILKVRWRCIATAAAAPFPAAAPAPAAPPAALAAAVGRRLRALRSGVAPAATCAQEQP
jgi:hypothetical protein